MVKVSQTQTEGWCQQLWHMGCESKISPNNDEIMGVMIDFIGPLPPDEGCDCIVSITDCLGGLDVQIIPGHGSMSAEDFALLFFKNWYCEDGLPLEIVSDHDQLFTSQFWKVLNKLT
jgi:hypothetical protein